MVNIPYNKLNEAVCAIQTAGLLVTSNQLILTPENKLIRVGTADKSKSKNGWYKILYNNQLDFITICYGNWQTQQSEKYHINLKDNSSYNKMSPIERQIIKAKIKEKIEVSQEEQNQEKQRKRNYYINEYNKLSHCYSHDYLTHKGIQYPQNYQLKIDTRFDRNLLCIPYINNNKQIQGYQSITTDGIKRFNGSVNGCYWQYPSKNPRPDIFEPSKNNMFYILCEGLVTGLSAYEAINYYFDESWCLPIILCAFNVGNLDKVISTTKSHRIPYLLLVDNDSTKTRNAGIEMAKTILKNHSDCLIYPLTFSDGNDANDYILKHGIEEFAGLINKYANPIINKLKR